MGRVIESPLLALTPEEKQRRRRKLVERHGRLRALNKLLYNAYRSRFVSAADMRIFREALFTKGCAVAYERSVPTITVSNINDPACITSLAARTVPTGGKITCAV